MQVLHTETWVRLNWNDPQLTWDPAKFGNVSKIYVPSGAVWKPDIIIYNEVGLEIGRPSTDFLISITSDGEIQWLYPRTVETSCKMDAGKYPFDVQRCNFIFGSWSLPGNMLDVVSKNEKGDDQHYVDNGEWILLNITVERHVLKYKCCPHPFPDVTFTLLLKRRSLYYIFNLIGPCLLITLLHLTSFLLPSESGEKISLNVTILLGLTVFLLLVAEIMPPQSEVIPVIGRFFAICIVIVSLSTVTSVFVLHLHFRGSRGFPVPRRMRVLVIGKLGRALLYGNLIEKKEERKRTPGENVTLNSLKITRKESYSNGGELSPPPDSPGHAISTLGCHDDYVLNTDAKPPMEDLGFPHRHVEDKSEAEKIIIRDWILVSLILDRLSFVFFCLADIVLVAYVCVHIYMETTS
ncbi:neuronal acetylcholine receptor subunit alpha-10-like [Liolophura sinensis]|uniref:neuronal acetylcholine receptor subunit alpha-10-like n=1 Tax=Liolophura sinensis TaxID=3198878 RepID=UPI0031582390